MDANSILAELGIAKLADGGDLDVTSPITGERIGRVKTHS